MEEKISVLIRNFLDTKNELYFEDILEKFMPLIHSYAYKLYYLDYEDCKQELSIALFEAVIKMKYTDDEYACISYIRNSVIHKFTKLYHESIREQKIQSCRICIDHKQNELFHYNYKTDDCITKADLNNELSQKSDSERKILKLIILGYSDKEISQEMGCSRQYINRIKKHILNKSV